MGGASLCRELERLVSFSATVALREKLSGARPGQREGPRTSSLEGSESEHGTIPKSSDQLVTLHAASPGPSARKTRTPNSSSLLQRRPTLCRHLILDRNRSSVCISCIFSTSLYCGTLGLTLRARVRFRFPHKVHCHPDGALDERLAATPADGPGKRLGDPIPATSL